MGVIFMNKQKTFAVVGGDLRQVHVANRLSGEGYQVYGMLLETNMALDESVRCTNDISGILPKCDVVILPMPVTTDDVNINAPFTSYKVRVEDCIKPVSYTHLFIKYPHGFCRIDRGTAADGYDHIRLKVAHGLSAFKYSFNGGIRFNTCLLYTSRCV